MSKIGRVPVKLNNAKAEISNKLIKISGANGTLSVDIPECVNVELKEGELFFTITDENYPNARAYWGLVRSLVNNAVKGVQEKFQKELEMVGVGYRVEKNGTDLKILIGYSHPVIVKAPQGITLDVEGNTIIKVSGADRQAVGQVAANIRAIREPEPYKGKGIKYKDELIKRKQGKASK